MMQILNFSDYQAQTEALGILLGLPCHTIATHRFPDQEVKVTLPAIEYEHVVVCRSLHYPDGKLIELMLMADSLRQQGVKRITLIAPYLCYMRQDTSFLSGEVVSQAVIGRFLANLFDDVVSVDPHLHRVDTLAAAIPARLSLALSAAPLLASFLASSPSSTLLLGPDSESAQWVSSVGQQAGLPYAVGEKQRLGDRKVCITLPPLPWQDHEVIVVDDIASSGRTLIEAAAKLKQQGVQRIHALITHALFAKGAYSELQQAGYENIWSTDSIPHPSNTIALAPLLASAIRSLPSP